MADRTHAGRGRFAARGRRLAQARVVLRTLLRLTDRGGWVAHGVLGCAYPRTERALAALSAGGVGLLVNLHGRPHEADVPLRTDRPVPKRATDGPFRYSRNPSYLALAMIYAGVAILRNSLWTMLLLPLVLLVIRREVIGREERYLERVFGEEYRAYKNRLRRWV